MPAKVVRRNSIVQRLPACRQVSERTDTLLEIRAEQAVDGNTTVLKSISDSLPHSDKHKVSKRRPSRAAMLTQIFTSGLRGLRETTDKRTAMIRMYDIPAATGIDVEQHDERRRARTHSRPDSQSNFVPR